MSLLEEDRVQQLEISVDSSRRGQTADPSVDTLHRDLLNLTAKKTAELADAIKRFGEFDTLFIKDILEYAFSKIEAGSIDRSLITAEARTKIRNLLGKEIPG